MVEINWWRISICLGEKLPGPETRSALRIHQRRNWHRSCSGIWFKKENRSLKDLSALQHQKSTSCLASSLDRHSRSFLQPFDPSPSFSPWTKGSASAERGCAVLAEVERGLSVCCSPSVSAHTLWSVPTGLRNRAQPDRERRQRTSEPQTLG